MKKVKSIFKKALAMMGENEVKAWEIGRASCRERV